MSVRLFDQATAARRRRSRLASGRVSPLAATVEFVVSLDFLLILGTLAISAVGLLMVYSATRNLFPLEPTYYIKRQIIYALLGAIAMCVFVVIDYRLFQRFGNLFYAFVLLALVAVRAIGHSSGYGNVIREISIGPLAIQPSEFAVLAVIISVANFVDGHQGAYSVRDMAKMAVIAGLPMVLVVLQPDLGTTMIIAVVLFTLLAVAGVRLRYLLAAALGAVAFFFLATHVHLLHSYQLQRITGFLNQSCNLRQNYNLCLSKTAIGAGGLRGAGLFQGAFTNNQYVPVQYADFIFSAIGEQLGFAGSLVVLGIFGIMAFRIYRAIGTAADRFGQMLCAGILAFFVFSVFQNVGMTMGLMPITGIPLPFVSYGGSALFVFFIALGIVINVERNAPSRR